MAHHAPAPGRRERGANPDSRADGRLEDFGRLTRPLQGRLIRIATAMCGDPEQGADLAQEALVRAFVAFARFKPGSPALPWLTRILRNVYLDQVKSARARREIAACDVRGPDDPIETSSSEEPSPLARLAQRELRALLLRELEALGPDQRTLVVLCDVEGFTYREAAEVLEIPVGTVRSRLSRCHERLRRRLRGRVATAAERGRDGVIK